MPSTIGLAAPGRHPQVARPTGVERADAISRSRSMVPLKRSPGGVHRSGRPRCSRAVKPPTWVAGSRCGRRANSEVEPRPDCEGSLIALPQSESNTRRRATFNPRGSTPWRLFRGWRRRAGSSQTNLDLERSTSREDECHHANTHPSRADFGNGHVVDGEAVGAPGPVSRMARIRLRRGSAPVRGMGGRGQGGRRGLRMFGARRVRPAQCRDEPGDGSTIPKAVH